MYDDDTFLESDDYNMNGHELCGNCAASSNCKHHMYILCTYDDSRVKMGQSSEKVGLCTVYQIETTILMIARIRIAALMLGIDNNKITPSLLSALQIALKD
mgnify:CR=1 FL=1